MEEKLEQFSQTLHSNHFVLLALKRRLLDLYRLLGEQEETNPIDLRRRLERQVCIVIVQLTYCLIIMPGPLNLSCFTRCYRSNLEEKSWMFSMY